MTSEDYEIEKIWLLVKASMNNFYNSCDLKLLKRNIDKWSFELNKLQLEKKYIIIERQIRDYMICYGIDVMRSGNGYHLNILKSNIKRWDKLTQKYGFVDNDCNDRSLFLCCLEICFILEKSNIYFGEFMENVELIVIQKNISFLLNIALLCKKISIYDSLIKNVKPLLIEELEYTYGKQHFKGIDFNTLKGKTLAKILLNIKI